MTLYQTSIWKKVANPGQPQKNLTKITDLELKKVAHPGQPLNNLNQITDLKSTNLLTSNWTYDKKVAVLGQPQKNLNQITDLKLSL